MPKFLSNIFGNKAAATVPSTTATKVTSIVAATTSNSYGLLETDALPIDDDDGSNAANNYQQPPRIGVTPTASADMTADMVRELSDPNYNSSMMEVMPAEGVGVSNALTTPAAVGTNNTMNVHNAQQQLVMQFSNVNQLHFGSVYNFNSNLSANASSSCKSACDDAEATPAAAIHNGNVVERGETKRQTPRKTVSVVAMMQSQEEPNHRLLETVATHLGEGWKLVMRNLGHSEGQIEQAVIDHQMHGGIKEVIYQLLLQWIRNADDGEATVARLTTMLWEMQHRDCVQRMKLVWKSNTQRKTSR